MPLIRLLVLLCILAFTTQPGHDQDVALKGANGDGLPPGAFAGPGSQGLKEVPTPIRNGDQDNPSSAAAVLAKISSMSALEQEKAVQSLAKYDLTDPRANEALTVLRKMVREPAMAPEGRAAAIRALGVKKDYESLVDIAECLNRDGDINLVVRRAAVEACNNIMSINLRFDPAGPPDERKRVADDYMANAILWHKLRSGK